MPEWQIKNIHSIVLKVRLPESAGVYRRENVLISGTEYIPPDFVQVPAQMAELLEWYMGEAQVCMLLKEQLFCILKYIPLWMETDVQQDYY